MISWLTLGVAQITSWRNNMILYGFAWMGGNGYASAALPVSEAVVTHFVWLVPVSEALMIPPYLCWGFLVLRRESVLPRQIALSNPLIFMGC